MKKRGGPGGPGIGEIARILAGDLEDLDAVLAEIEAGIRPAPKRALGNRVSSYAPEWIAAATARRK